MSRRSDQIIVSCLDSLWMMARRLVGGHEDAEDLVQETCLRAMRHAGTLESHRNPKAYLLRTLRNLSLDRWRAERSAPRVVSIGELRGEEGEATLADPRTLDAPAIIREALDDDVQAALDALPEELGSALWLREVEGFSYLDIADALGVPIGTVRSRLARARHQMAANLCRSRNQSMPPGPLLPREVRS